MKIKSEVGLILSLSVVLVRQDGFPVRKLRIKTILLDEKINQGSEYFMYKQIDQDYLVTFNLCLRDFRVARCDADQSDNEPISTPNLPYANN